jgi:hypothetical protein
MKLEGKNENDFKTDKKLIEAIKNYLNRKEIITATESITKSVELQNNHIDYIIQVLPVL